jgi:hypothetical protein
MIHDEVRGDGASPFDAVILFAEPQGEVHARGAPRAGPVRTTGRSLTKRPAASNRQALKLRRYENARPARLKTGSRWYEVPTEIGWTDR